MGQTEFSSHTHTNTQTVSVSTGHNSCCGSASARMKICFRSKKSLCKWTATHRVSSMKTRFVSVPSIWPLCPEPEHLKNAAYALTKNTKQIREAGSETHQGGGNKTQPHELKQVRLRAGVSVLTRGQQRWRERHGERHGEAEERTGERGGERV